MENLSVDNLDVKKKANIEVLNAEKIEDNGTVYGETGDVQSLTVDPSKNKNDAGVIPKPARVDHKHKIPDAIKNPNAVIIKGNNGSEVLNYDGSSKKELTLTPDNTGSAKKNHASTGTDFGLGNGSNYGHLKLSDSATSSSDVNGGVAATPKALQNLTIEHSKIFLKKTEDAQLSGYLKIKNSAYLNGTGAATDASTSSDNTLNIYGVGNQNIAKILFGTSTESGKKTLLASNNDSNLYLVRDNNLAQKLSNYEIEAFITPSSSDGYKKWSPAKSGWYRIYLVGGGGMSAAGYAESDATLSNDGTGYGHGTAYAGYGGGGGGVSILDILVGSLAYSDEATTDESEEDSTDTDVSETVDSYAQISFVKDFYVTGYGNDTDWAYLRDANGNKISGYRDVGISGIERIGTIVNKQGACTHDGYNAYASHGGDSYGASTNGSRYCFGGGSASGGSINYRGQSGDVDDNKPGRPSQAGGSANDDFDSSRKRRREDGYNGGVPGSVNITGITGGKGTPGALLSYKTYSSANVATYTATRCGSGASLFIKELDGFSASPAYFDPTKAFVYPKTTPSACGGYGYYGGGNGGGSAVVVTNSSYTKSVNKKATYNRTRTTLLPCCVIVYMGKQI